MFPPDCPDDQRLAQIGEFGWIAITHNARIRYIPNERDAITRHGVSLLVVVGKAPLKELAENFIATLPRIREFLARHKAPLIAKVYRPTPAERMERSDAPGSIVLWYPK